MGASEKALEVAVSSSVRRHGDAAYYIRRVLAIGEGIALRLDGDPAWPVGLHALALVRMHERFGFPAYIAALERFFNAQIDAQGRWRTPPKRAAHALPAYSLLYLQRIAPALRWESAVHQMAGFLLHDCPRESDGSLRYVPQRPDILVDTLGMVCPFLAGFGRHFSNPSAVDLAVLQISTFTRLNCDLDSRLPYHAYRAGGPFRLGLQGWGRGSGWYLLGLVDTLVEAPSVREETLTKALLETAHALRKWQRPDGHWSWVIPMPDATADSSVTAFCGYALARAVNAGLLDSGFSTVIDLARRAIIAVTDRHGLVGHGSGECSAPGVYSMHFGPQPWTQGASAAFLAEWPSA